MRRPGFGSHGRVAVALFEEEYQECAALITQPVDVEFGANWNKTARVCIEQRDPVPMTVTAVVPGLEYGGRDE